MAEERLPADGEVPEGYRPFVVDVLVEGQGIDRQVRVLAGPEKLVFGRSRLSYSAVYWTSRRAGLLMLFSQKVTVALRGEEADLHELARTVESGLDSREHHQNLLQPLGGEGVLFTAGTALVGRLQGEVVKGLAVAVCSQRGLHLFSGSRHRALRWPVDSAEERRRPGAAHAEKSLRLVKGEDVLDLLYLFPEEIAAVRRVARQELRPEASGPELELFSRRDVARPTQAELPEFMRAAAALPEIAEAEAGAIGDDLRARAEIGPHFFETHFLELGEIALGPVLLRKSAASGARSLTDAIRAMDAGQLAEDTRTAVGTAAERLVEVYTRELDRRVTEKRAPVKLERELDVSERQRDDLTRRLLTPFQRLAPVYEQLEERQSELSVRLERLESGPPEGDEAVVQAAASDWREVLQRLDHGYEQAWKDMAMEVRRSWEEAFLPRLARVSMLPRRRVPEWAQLVLIALFTLLVAAALVFWLRG